MAGWLSKMGVPREQELRAAVSERKGQPVPVPDATVAPAPTISVDLLAQYRELVHELGVAQPGLEKEAALSYFRERGTRLYDGRKVHAFLDDQYGPERIDEPGHLWVVASWIWRPLREKDRVPRTGVTHRRNGAVASDLQTYQKPLPLPVLVTVREVAAKFPAARFYVSDEYRADEVRDPFLMVVLGGEQFIIERWDEPGYRE